VGYVFPLLLMLALIGACAFAIRRLSGFSRRIGRTRSLPLEVIDRIAVAPKQGVAIVRFGERALLVGVGDGGVRTLAELTPDECAQLPSRSSAATGAPSVTSFSDALRRSLVHVRRTAMITGFVAMGAFRPAQAAASIVDDVPAVQAAASAAQAQAAPGVAPRISLQLGTGGDNGLRISGAVGSVITIGLLAMLPAMLLLMTSFTRILIVLHFLRQAMGTQTTPPGQLLAALALILTGFVMAPALAQVNTQALRPWMNGEIAEGEMLTRAVAPLRTFMLEQTPESDLARYVDLSGEPAPAAPEEVSLPVLVTAFAMSELRAAFQMGFAIFLPFIVIDLVVSAVLTSMGMFMLPPTMIALPCKLLLFVLADGWNLTVQSLIASFR